MGEDKGAALLWLMSSRSIREIIPASEDEKDMWVNALEKEIGMHQACGPPSRIRDYQHPGSELPRLLKGYSCDAVANRDIEAVTKEGAKQNKTIRPAASPNFH